MQVKKTINKGNKYAQKHTKEKVIEILEDIYNGLVNHYTKDIKKISRSDSDDSGEDKNTTEEKYTERVGYAALEEGLIAHGLYPSKLSEWANTWKDDNDVSEAVKAVRELRATSLVANTMKGSIPPSVGIFLMKAQLGLSDGNERNVTEDSKYMCDNMEEDK